MDLWRAKARLQGWHADCNVCGMAPRTLRDPLGLWPNTLAIAYAFGGYAAALHLITREGLIAPICGTLLLASYHRHRVRRVTNGDPPGKTVDDGRDFVGVVGVSFLTAH